MEWCQGRARLVFTHLGQLCHCKGCVTWQATYDTLLTRTAFFLFFLLVLQLFGLVIFLVIWGWVKRNRRQGSSSIWAENTRDHDFGNDSPLSREFIHMDSTPPRQPEQAGTLGIQMGGVSSQVASLNPTVPRQQHQHLSNSTG